MVMHIQLCTIHFTPVRPAGCGHKAVASEGGMSLRLRGESRVQATRLLSTVEYQKNFKIDNPCPFLDRRTQKFLPFLRLFP